MKNSITKKLSSCSGESIGETLVALLISALALVMMAGAVSAAMRVVTDSKDRMDEYYQVSNAVVARETAAPKINGADASEFAHGTGLSVQVGNLLPTGTIPPVEYWKNEQLGGIPVIAYSSGS